MLTFKMMLMWLATFVAIVIITILLGAIFSVLDSRDVKGEVNPIYSWLITCLLLSITCVMLAYS